MFRHNGSSAGLLVPGRVVAASKVPLGILSAPIEPHQLKGSTDVMQISVEMDALGSLHLEDRSRNMWNQGVHWVRAIRLAEDCHSYNVMLRKLGNEDGSAKSRLILQVVKHIGAGEELLLWFSEDILPYTQMVFLTPANIQGQKNYVCTRCSALFEYPNPLKLHLTLGCGMYSVSALWDGLCDVLSAQTVNSISEFKFKLTPESSEPKQRVAIDLSASPEKKSKHEDLYRPYTTQQRAGSGSAFKPFKKIENNNTITTTLGAGYWPMFVMPQEYIHGVSVVQSPLSDVQSCDDAQMETLVSNMGKFREGHICLYCGKSYSRKYGLKIHIRTHTGYKPLKCKFCMRPFGDPSNLNKHIRLHAEGETPYKCEHCGKVLVRRRDLERHLKSRHSQDKSAVISNTDEESNEVSYEEKVAII